MSDRKKQYRTHPYPKRGVDRNNAIYQPEPDVVRQTQYPIGFRLAKGFSILKGNEKYER